MEFLILSLLKVALYMKVIGVRNNRFEVFILTSLFVLFIFSNLYYTNSHIKRKLGIFLYSIFSIILFIDVLHFSFFSMLPTVTMLDQLGQVGAVGDSLKEILNIESLLMLVDLPIVYLFSRRKKAKADMVYSKNRRFLLPSLILVILISSILILDKKGKLDAISKEEVFTYHYRDLKKSMDKDKDLVLKLKDGQSPEDLIRELKSRAKLVDGEEFRAVAKGKNLIVIQVESLQNFPIGLKHLGQEITPNLNKLIDKEGSIYFDNYYQMVGIGNTSDAEFVSNNSLYPSQEGPSYTSYVENDFYGLPLLLKDNGYESWAFHGYERTYWNRDKAYNKQGFTRFLAEDDYVFKEEDKIGFGINDEDFYKQSIDYIKDLDRQSQGPFYAFLISLSNHHPYKLPEKYRDIDIDEKYRDSIVGNYLQSVYYTDKQIGKFIEDLKNEGLYDETVIAIYGDHFGISANNQKDKELMTGFLNKPYDVDEMMKIPLIIHVPGLEANKKVSSLGSQLDFYPTISNILGLENKKGIVFGRDLLNYKGDNIVAPHNYLARGSFISQGKLLKMSQDGMYENSSVYRIEDRELLDPKDLRSTYEEVLNEINVCRYLMKNNVMKDILEGKENFDLAISENSGLKLDREIKTVDSSFEAMDQAVSQGYKTLKVKFRYEKNQNSYDILIGNRGLEEIVAWLEANPEVNIVGDVEDKADYRNVFMLMQLYHKFLLDRVYPSIDSLDLYQDINGKGYNVILDISENNISEEKLEEFIKRYNLKLIAMDYKDYDRKKAKSYKSKDILTIVYNVGRKEKWILKRDKNILSIIN